MVVRGPDWEWGSQDGGEGKPGRVVDIRGWDVETGRSVASVTWADGTTNVYRMGHKGKVDLKCVAEAAGGFYYKEHLPILGKPAELQRRVSADSQTFQHGDKVKCLLDTDVLREMQDGHGGWNPRMAEVSCPARWPRARPPLHPLDPQPSCCARPQSPRPATVYRTDGHRAPHHRPWGRARAVQPRDPLDLPP